jgi:hypothetical protein
MSSQPFLFFEKQRVFIRVGSWSHHHLAITPKAIWCSRDSYNKPMLWISTLSMAFSPAIGTLELQTIAKNHEQNSDVDSQSGIDRESESESDLKRDSIEEEKHDVNVLHPSINLPPNEFPLLNSLGVQNESLMNGLLQEVIKYYGSNLGIEFMQRNNQPGFLILCPSSRNTERYTSELVKKKWCY